MVEFAKNKWKYSTIALAAILAVGFSFPQAFAHVTSNVPHAFQHILDALAPMQQDIDEIQSDIDALGEGNMKAITIDKEVQIFASPGGDESLNLELLPRVEGVTYSGHITGGWTVREGNTAAFDCEISGRTVTLAFLSVQVGTEFGTVDAHFSCEELVLDVFTQNEDPGTPVNISASVTYTEISDTTEIS